MFQPEDRVGDVVTRFPGAADVFRAHGIDFCCGGQRSVLDAASQQGVPVQPLLDELNQRYTEARARSEQEVDWSQQPISDLVDHIVNHHHAYLHTTLPVMGELVTKILRVHGQHHPELAQVHRLFHELKTDLEQHLIEEETRIFPRVTAWAKRAESAAGSELAQTTSPHASTPAQGSEQTSEPVDLDALVRDLEELESDHDRAGDLLKELRRVTGDYAVPEDGCGTYHYVFQKLEEIEGKTFLHVHLENNVLFPRLRANQAQPAR
ncbi:iron-sulfur cluster repair di-iron protein [Alicyclobacillus sp.]|uniref:iron-sulfur cluster repair di-iron protein n=1 Tax=Alicyclobacillus sp. TaxID=61169 RepID=UPI0025BE150F|nr:iron-sulfur cluster repair di-iron protein [Alicyclobacillus sp.]MCL6517279.1 iron-sulfur cluster repair di-iron protein [Alicyclobacillus sp.]